MSMRMLMAFDLTADAIGQTLWWNPEDGLDPAGPGHIEIPVEAVQAFPPSPEFPGGGVVVSADWRIIPGNSMVGLTEEKIPESIGENDPQ